jgi:hypothetical protein
MGQFERSYPSGAKSHTHFGPWMYELKPALPKLTCPPKGLD